MAGGSCVKNMFPQTGGLQQWHFRLQAGSRTAGEAQTTALGIVSLSMYAYVTKSLNLHLMDFV